jgi:hypothetical protein
MSFTKTVPPRSGRLSQGVGADEMRMSASRIPALAASSRALSRGVRLVFFERLEKSARSELRISVSVLAEVSVACAAAESVEEDAVWGVVNSMVGGERKEWGFVVAVVVVGWLRMA